MSKQLLHLTPAMSLWAIFECAANRVTMLFEKRHLPVERINDHHVCTVRFSLTFEIAEKISSYAAVTLLLIDPYHFDMRAVPALDTCDDPGDEIPVFIKDLLIEPDEFMLIWHLRMIVFAKTVIDDIRFFSACRSDLISTDIRRNIFR